MPGGSVTGWRDVVLAALAAALAWSAGAAPIPGAGPISVAATEGATQRILAVAVGDGYACTIEDDQSVVCWGDVDGEPFPSPGGTFTAISMGTGHACGIRTDGTVACWGDDSEGQGTPPAGAFGTVSAGLFTSCGIRDDGTAACWGWGMESDAVQPSGTWIDVVAGDGDACGIRTDGSLECWGNLGGHRANLPGGTFTRVVGGIRHGCAMRTDRTIACWKTGDDEPGTDPPPGTFTTIAAGNDRVCGLRPDGAVVCWGFGNGRLVDSPPTEPLGVPVTDVSVGRWVCGPTTDGALVCNKAAAMPRPSVRLHRLADWVTGDRIRLRWQAESAFAAVTRYDVRYRQSWVGWPYGRWHLAGSTRDTHWDHPVLPGATTCFAVRARDAAGRTGTWSSLTCTVAPVDDAAATRTGSWTPVTGDRYYDGTASLATARGAALRFDGVRAFTLGIVVTMCPGCGEIDVLWNGRIWRTVNLDAPRRVDHKVILLLELSDDQPEGRGSYLAEGPFVIRVRSSGKPVIVDGLLATGEYAVPYWADPWSPPTPDEMTSARRVTAVSAGSDHTCAVLASGRLVCWGDGEAGRTRAPEGSYIEVSVSDYGSCARAADGDVTCWGQEPWVEGTGVRTGVAAMSASDDGICSIREDATLACTGWAFEGEGGEAPPEGTFTAVSVGGSGACAIATDGRLACWGNARFLGRAPDATFTAVSVGTAHACAIRTDGTLACWGDDEVGQASAPLGRFRSVSVGLFHSCGVRTNGRLACWGSNEHFQLVRPPGRHTAVEAGARHTCAIRTDGRLTCWGDDASGQVSAAPLVAGLRVGLSSRRQAVTLAWHAGALRRIVRADVRVRIAPWNEAFGAWRAAGPATAGESTRLRAEPGTTICAAVRVRDRSRRVSDWSRQRCAAVPLDDRVLERSDGWRTVAGDALYHGAAIRATTPDEWVRLRRVEPGVVSLVATTCPTCGSVEIRWGSDDVAVVDLASPQRTDRAVVRACDLVGDWGAWKPGTLTIRVVGDGQVTIDGISITRTHQRDW